MRALGRTYATVDWGVRGRAGLACVGSGGVQLLIAGWYTGLGLGGSERVVFRSVWMMKLIVCVFVSLLGVVCL